MLTTQATAPTSNTDGTALTNLSGYIINYGTSAGALNKSVTVSGAGTLKQTIANLSTGTWYFGIVAVTNTGLKSNLSSVASATIS